MTLNFNIKITSGARTPIKIEAYSTAVNPKILEFQHSKKTLTSTQIEIWLNKSLKEVLEKYRDQK